MLDENQPRIQGWYIKLHDLPLGQGHWNELQSSAVGLTHSFSGIGSDM
jgi:hypothetical protein